MAEKKTAKKPESSDKTFKASDIKFQAKTSSSRSKYKHDKFSRKEILLGLVLVLFLAIPVVFFAFSGDSSDINVIRENEVIDEIGLFEGESDHYVVSLKYYESNNFEESIKVAKEGINAEYSPEDKQNLIGLWTISCKESFDENYCNDDIQIAIEQYFDNSINKVYALQAYALMLSEYDTQKSLEIYNDILKNNELTEEHIQAINETVNRIKQT